ncbi:hypothetical protein BKA62DRAFT_636572 [Auriculariales sp. MPI-PUGE-AT-0066]|nr:hypothetical protein BKA62DRAFT_636572 [Auriculariales sp. MPI-PUGE-AT-0066]
MYYSNRSACYLYFQPPRNDLVIKDCDSALQLDKTYVKPLARRANAHEAVGNLQEALDDFTAAVILDRFQTQSNNAALDRVLKALATKTASDTIKNRTPRLPSSTFITAFFASFRPQKRPALPAAPTAGDLTFQEALDALEAFDYVKTFSLVGDALDNAAAAISDNKARAYALNLRGTFQFLMGDAKSAKVSFEASIAAAPKYANSYVKLASVYMDFGDAENTFQTYENAIKADPDDPDVYYQRGQVFFIMGDFAKASADYQKSIDLDAAFVFSHIQLAVAQYKMGTISKSMATFRATMRTFPNMSEPLNYYGELLLDQSKFEEAVKKFEDAIALEAVKPAHAANVLPLVNKGLALFQWKNDINEAEKYCQLALDRDPECEAAIATLAQLLLQHSRLREACEMFRRHVAIGRSEMEIQATLNYLLATEAQLRFIEVYPEKADMLSDMARSMQQ